MSDNKLQLEQYQNILKLLRLGMGRHVVDFPKNIDWPPIIKLAMRQGIYAVILDGIELLPEENRPPKNLMLEWIGEVLQGYENRYELYRRAISELAGFYNLHGFKMMVLKGFACSLNWPKPNHRPCGDIDIWLFGNQKDADGFMAKEKGIKIDKSHHHHTVFNWGEFTVENHYDFVNVHAHRSSAELEKVFKELGQDDSHYVELKDASTGSVSKVYLPSPNLHALFLIKHMVSHFAAAEISLRQVMDWAFFVEKHSKKIDWKWLDGMLEKYGMKDFVNCINGICVEDLGFDAGVFHEVKFLPELKDRILMDILNPEYTSEEPTCFMPRMAYKLKRWNGNAWKHDLCYKESRWDSFWSGVWAKIIKPSAF